MDLRSEILRSKKFQEFQFKNPVCAKYWFDDLMEKWEYDKKYFIPYINAFRKANTGIPWGDGKIAASMPQTVIIWLEFERGHRLHPDELWEYIKEHKQYWAVDNL